MAALKMRLLPAAAGIAAAAWLSSPRTLGAAAAAERIPFGAADQ